MDAAPAAAKTTLDAIGLRLAQAREKQRLSQSRLGAKAGLTDSTIARIEAGASVQVSSLVAVVRALGLDWDYVMEGRS